MAEHPPQPTPLAAVPSCPICKHATTFSVENRYRPFCSARCQRIDLGNWLDERYVVPGAHAPQAEERNPTADQESREDERE